MNWKGGSIGIGGKGLISKGKEKEKRERGIKNIICHKGQKAK